MRGKLLTEHLLKPKKMTEKEIKRFRYLRNKKAEYQKELELRPLKSEFDFQRLRALIAACNEEMQKIGEPFSPADYEVKQ